MLYCEALWAITQFGFSAIWNTLLLLLLLPSYVSGTDVTSLLAPNSMTPNGHHFNRPLDNGLILHQKHNDVSPEVVYRQLVSFSSIEETINGIDTMNVRPTKYVQPVTQCATYNGKCRVSGDRQCTAQCAWDDKWWIDIGGCQWGLADDISHKWATRANEKVDILNMEIRFS